MESPAGRTPAPRALPYYVAFSQLLGLTVVAVTGAWLGAYRGGIAWESALQFNVHPLCMIIGLVFLQGDGESWGPCHLREEIFGDPLTPEVSAVRGGSWPRAGGP